MTEFVRFERRGEVDRSFQGDEKVGSGLLFLRKYAMVRENADVVQNNFCFGYFHDSEDIFFDSKKALSGQNDFRVVLLSHQGFFFLSVI